MKFLAILITFSCPVQAALLANVQTTQGTIVVELQYDKAPQAVANFITLAQGTRSRIVQSTGAITYAPLYIGENFFRVINDPSFKIAQTGSGTGNNSGGPGYTFRDEFHPTLTHVPYVLSMANSGPNSNGSQIFFTGNASAAHLNHVHTIFGLITDVPSRAVIDAVLSAGDNGATITGISFNRTDPAAIAFDEFAQNLPTIVQPSGSLTVILGVSATWNLSQAMSTGALFRAFRSTTLESGSWLELNAARQYVGITPPVSPPSVTTALLENPSAPKAFYNLSVAQHPGSVAPSNLVNRTVTIPLIGGTLTLAFNGSGAAGTTTFTPTTGSVLSGAFTAFQMSFDPNHVSFITDTPSLSPRYLRVKCGCDTATQSLISGHHVTEKIVENDWKPFATGSATITR